MRSALALSGFLLLVGVAAAFGAAFQPGDWYEALRKPPLNPPNRAFGIVWPVLYGCIALAGWLAWRAGAGRRTLTLWAAQLALNAAWSWLFFGLHRPGVALVELVLLLALVVATIAALLRTSRTAGLLLVPYALWVAFAGYLNAGIWILNR